MYPALAAGLALALLFTLYLRGDRKAARKLAADQREILGQVLEEVTSLRSALVASGAVERAPAAWPPGVQPPAPPVPTGALPAPLAPTEAPPLADEAKAEEPPSTKPSQSRQIPAAAPPRSAPRPVSFDDQVRRAMARLEGQVKVPPDVEARWLERLRTLGAELGLSDEAAPTEEQVEAMIRELYQAEADVKDARDAAPPPVEPTATEATLPSADGDTTPRREGRRTVLPRASADEDLDGDGRDTAEDMTKVYSRGPGEADAGLPGVEVKPKPAAVRAPPHKPPRPLVDPLAGVKPERPTSSPTRTAEEYPARRPRPTLLGGLGGPRAPQSGDQEGGDGR
jgi:hypothetical protein